MAKRIAVKGLRAGSIEAAPINVEDWKDIFSGYDETGESNEFWEASTCQDCGAVIALHMGGGNETHANTDPENESECQGYMNSAEGPMMNYWYAFDFDQSCATSPENAAELIADLPLCVVHINGQYGLALTGGGMDLSWEICEAYTRLGLLPPVHFCDLPSMAGRGDSARDRYIISACRESLRVQMNWAKNKLRNLRGFGKK